MGNYVDIYRAVYKAICRDDYIAINYYIADCRTFLVY